MTSVTSSDGRHLLATARPSGHNKKGRSHGCAPSAFPASDLVLDVDSCPQGHVGRNNPPGYKLLDALLHRHHPPGAARLHRGDDLVGLVLTDKISDGRCRYQYFRGHN